MTNPDDPRVRLEYLRGELRAERISMGELIELQGLAEHIEPGDVELLEAAGVPEFPESPMTPKRQHAWNRAAAALRELRAIVEAETEIHQDDNEDVLGTLDTACDYFDQAQQRDGEFKVGAPFKRWTLNLANGSGHDIYVTNMPESERFILSLATHDSIASAWGEDAAEVPLP